MLRRPSCVLVAVASVASSVLHAQVSETWQCFNFFDSDRDNVLFEVFGAMPAGEQYGLGIVSIGGFVQGATFYIDGLDRRWDFGDNVYSFIITPDGTGTYFDFSNVEEGESTEPSEAYKCELSE